MLKVNLIQKENIIVSRIDVAAKSYLQDKIDKLNKKAVALGCEPMKLSFSNDFFMYRKGNSGVLWSQAEYDRIHALPPSPTGIQKYVLCYAKLSYTIPKIDGWELICTFDIVPVGMNEETGEPILEVFTSKVPDKHIPVEWQNIKEIKCDHCGHNRFRNHSMLMYKAETGEYKEVGSTCIKDFFGHNPKGFMLFARFVMPDLDGYGGELEDGMDYEYSGQGYRMGCDRLETLLAMTSACIKKWGWTSATYAYNYGGSSTKDAVVEQLNPPKGWQHLDWFEKIYPNEDDEKVANDAIEHFKNLSADEIGDNDYLMNCHKVAKHNMVPWKLTGVACSMIATYQKIVAQRIKDEKFANLPPSGFVGDVGERLKEIPVTCVMNKELPDNYTGGTMNLYIWIDENGNKYKTFYRGHKWSMSAEETALLTGTVKKHDEWNDEKSTMLTRCVVVKGE